MSSCVLCGIQRPRPEARSSMQYLISALALLVCALVAGPATAQTSDPSRVAARHAHRAELFEPNIGQFPSAAKFVARAAAYDVVFADDHVDLVASHGQRVRMLFPGARAGMLPSGLELGSATVSVFRHDASRRGAAMFREVRYRSIYRGVDLSFTFNAGRLEQTWIIAPGADPASISIRFAGARGVTTDGREVLIRTAFGVFRLLQPFVYEDAPGGRLTIDASYVRSRGDTLAFRLGPHRCDASIVIDPIVEYATYFGGSDVDWNESETIAIDPEGSVYVAGKTSSVDLPSRESSVLPSLHGEPDLFITKFRFDGTLVFTAYIGGTGFETDASAIAVDATGVYMAFGTESDDLPTTPDAFQPRRNYAKTATGPKPEMDGAVVKLSPDGTKILYATYFGGTDDERFVSIALGADGRIVVAGRTSSPDFPVTSNAFQSRLGTSRAEYPSDAVVVAFDSAGRLLASTLIGGSDSSKRIGEDQCHVLVDDNGNVIVAGRTTSADFPTTDGAMQRVNTAGSTTAFLTRFTPDLSQLVFSTYFGGFVNHLRQIAFDPSGDIYAVGDRQVAAFVTRIAADGTHEVWRRNLGTAETWGFGIVAAPGQTVWVCGLTGSDSFPVTPDAFQTKFTGTRAQMTSFLTQLDSGDGSIRFSTYFGGMGSNEVLTSLAIDRAGKLWAWGNSNSAVFPVSTDAAQHEVHGAVDGVLVRIAVETAPVATTTTITSTPNPASLSQIVTFTATVNTVGASGVVIFFDAGGAIGSASLSNGSASFSTAALSAGSHTVTASYQGEAGYGPSTSQPLIQLVSSGPHGPRRRAVRRH